MFHSRNGLFFQATGQGTVAIVATNDGKEPFSRSAPDSDKVETNIVCNVTLPENEWASVVCSVSKDGETAERWKRARLFHGTEFSELYPSGLDEAPRAPTAEEEEWMNAPMGTPRPADKNSVKALIAAVDDVLRALGFVIHDERRVSLEMMRDHLLWERAAANDRYQADQQFRNMLSEIHEKHVQRVREASAAHQIRLKAAGMGA